MKTKITLKLTRQQRALLRKLRDKSLPGLRGSLCDKEVDRATVAIDERLALYEELLDDLIELVKDALALGGRGRGE